MDNQIVPFDSIQYAFKIIVNTGFYKLIDKSNNRFRVICHNIYRVFAFVLITVFQMQSLIFIVQLVMKGKGMDSLLDTLVVFLPQVVMPVNVLAFNFNHQKVDAINKLLNDKVFFAYSKSETDIMNKNNDEVQRIYKLVLYGISIGEIFYVVTPLVKRWQDENFVLPYYFPFDTQNWNGIIYASLVITLYLPWVAFGHIFFDCLIAVYYAQARCQLKIIKLNLENLTELKSGHEETAVFRLYTDGMEKEINGKFTQIVHRYSKVLWYVKTVNEIFNIPLLCQFTVTSTALCLVVYKMTTPYTKAEFVSKEPSDDFLQKLNNLRTISVDPDSFEIIFWFLYVFILLGQIIFYCVYGSLINYESQSITTSAYFCDWLSLPPAFRKQMVIAMTQWNRIITPSVFGLVPLSLQTVLTIIRSSYSLFTVLTTVK